MEKILILGKDKSSLTDAIGFTFVLLPRFASDEERHDFIITHLKPLEFDKLIILIDAEDNYDGLKIALHIRLTIDLHQKRLAPLLFVSSYNLSVVLRSTGIWGRILTTKGCKLEKPDVKAIQSGIQELPKLLPVEMSYFVNSIQLQPDEKTGRHSLANQWGAYALDKAAGTRALKNNPALTKAKKHLYFKYILAKNYNNTKLKLNSPPITRIEIEKPRMQRIEASGKKVLLIDDEADKGWYDVLRMLFKTSNPESDFQVISRKINRWSDYSDDERKLILETGFDLFLVDLRLTGSEEEDNVVAGSFTGTEVMQSIKQSNEGNQVIMFTASNKAWNLKALLNLGVDGYYIKESPEYNFSERFSEDNFLTFKTESELCLTYSFLRIICQDHKETYTHLKSTPILKKYNKEQQNKLKQISTQLDISYKLLHMRQPQSLSYFVITYVRILEVLSDIFIQVDKNNKTIILNNRDNLQYFKRGHGSLKYEYELISFDSDSLNWDTYKSILNQTICLACQLFAFDPKRDKLLLKQIDTLIRRRNDFVHEGVEVYLNVTELLGWTSMMKHLLSRI